jgi:hypothetical protein
MPIFLPDPYDRHPLLLCLSAALREICSLIHMS